MISGTGIDDVGQVSVNDSEWYQFYTCGGVYQLIETPYCINDRTQNTQMTYPKIMKTSDYNRMGYSHSIPMAFKIIKIIVFSINNLNKMLIRTGNV